MKLTATEVERFYAVWMPLILFVNRRLRLVPEMLPAKFKGPWDVEKVAKIRDAMWADDSHRHAFIAENPAKLSTNDLALVASWQHRLVGEFYVLRQLKQYGILLHESNVYGVLGLTDPLGEIVPFMPCFIKTVLIPFGDRIIYDSLLTGYNVFLGKGIRSSLEKQYKDAKERGPIITSLLPSLGAASHQDQQETVLATNAKVLDAFRTQLYRAGLSPKVVERDLANVTSFAEDHLLNLPSPCSLRQFDSDDVRKYVSFVRTSADFTDARRRAALTSFKRFLRFLLDTERMDFESAESALEMLKGRG